MKDQTEISHKKVVQMGKKIEIRTKVISTAQAVFTRYGYAKTTMEDIAKEMGKGKSTIYYYFTSKEDIFKAVIEMELEVMKTNIIDHVTGEEDARQKLKVYVVERMHGLKKFENLYNVLRTELITLRDFVDKTRQQTDKEEIRIVGEILQKGVEDGIFHLEDTILTSIAIVTALKGMEIPLLVSDIESEHLLEQRLDRLLDVLFFGIVKR